MRVDLAASIVDHPAATRATEILRKCVHCGFCNATCPTYNLLGEELDGPRGRIYQIKGLLESGEVSEQTQFHLDRCLTCRNCETTCPSGVEYGELLEIGRDFLAERSESSTWLEKILLFVVPRPQLLRTLVRLGTLFKFFLPMTLKAKIPPLPPKANIVSHSDATITLIQGCAQQALTPDVNQHLAQLLKARDIAVRIATDETCCGGMHLHLGKRERASQLMESNVEALHRAETEVYVSSASGCGVTMKDYGRLVDSPHASEVAERTRDLCEYLKGLRFSKHPNIKRIALHNPCSLQHGQGVHGRIESILTSTGYELATVEEPQMCCGSAGTYSFLQTDLANQLKVRKLKNLQVDAPDVIATANIGCQLHLSEGSDVPVVHWVKLLN